MKQLDEVSEKDATGLVAEIYQDIRVRLGIPFVNLIYRHLATRPEILEAIWSSVVDSLDMGSVSRSVADYIETMNPTWLEPLPPIFLEACGLVEKERHFALTTLNAYERSNQINAVIFTNLLTNLENQGENYTYTSGKWQPQLIINRVEQTLPMQDITLLSPPQVEMLEALSNITIGRQGGINAVPSMFRHFAQNNSLMIAFWVALSSTETRKKLMVWETNLKQRALEDASQIKLPRVNLDPETTKVLTVFGNTIIIRMLGVGRILQRMMSGEM